MAKSSKKGFKIKKEEFEQLISSVKTLEEDVKALKERLEGQPTETSETSEEKLKELSESLRGELKKEIEAISEEINTLKEELSKTPKLEEDKLLEEIEHLKTTISNLEEKLTNLESAIGEIGDTVDLKLEPIRSEVQYLREKLSEVGSSLQAIDERTKELEETFTDTYAELEEKLQSSISELRDELNSLSERIGTMELPSIDSLAESLGPQLLTQVSDQIVEITSELNNLKSNLSMLESTLEDVNQLKLDVQTKLSDIQLITNTVEEMNKLLTDLRDKVDALEGLRDELSQISNRQSYVEERFGDLQSEVSELSSKISELETQLNQLSSELGSKIETIHDMLSNIDPSIVEKAEEASRELASISEKLSTMESMIDDYKELKAKVQELSQQIIDRESIQFMIDTTQEQKIEELLRRIEEVEEKLGLSPDKLITLMESEDVKSVIDRLQDEKIAELERKIEELRSQDRSVFQQMIDEAQDQQIRELEERLKELEDKLSQVTKEEMSKIDELQNAKIAALEERIKELSKRLDDAFQLLRGFRTSEEELTEEEEEELQPSPDLKLTMSILLEKIMLRQDIDATDLHIKPGNKPVVRINGQLHPVGKYILTPGDAYKLIKEISKPRHISTLKRQGSVNFSFTFKDTRFRVNAFKQINGYAAAIRKIKSQIGSFEELYLPPILEKLSQLRDGLIIVAGPTGSGKSTTIAAMIEYINQNFPYRIITIEDPIEYVFTDKESVISQREVGVDTPSYFEGLKDALREDPDVIFIGELRDPETTWVATTAAETGHLVLTTLHSSDTLQAVNRLLDMFMGEKKVQFRYLLATTLRAVIAQKLIERDDGKGMVPAVEIMVVTPTIRTLIREGNIDEIYDYILEGEFDGMQTFSDSLAELVHKGIISKEKAMLYAEKPEEFSRKITERTLSSGREIEF